MEKNVIDKRLDYEEKVGKATDINAWKNYLEKQQEKGEKREDNKNYLSYVRRKYYIEKDNNFQKV